MKIQTLTKIIFKNIQISFCYFFNKTPPLSYKLLLDLTTRCNLSCQVCGIWKEKHSDLEPEILKKVFKSFSKDLLWLSLSGGEISLYPYFNELVSLAKENCPNLQLVTFTSNGQDPEKILQLALILKASFPDVFITLSLDGPEAIHNQLRGNTDAYKKLKITFDLLKNHSLTCYWGSTIQNGNSSFFTNHWAQKLDIKAFTFTHSEGIYKQHNPSDDLNLLKALRVIFKNYKIRSPGEWLEHAHIAGAIQFLKTQRKMLPIPCDIPKSALHLSVKGEIFYCMFMPSLGELKMKNIFEILQGEVAAEQKNRIANEQCPQCWLNCYSPHSMMLHPFKTLNLWLKTTIQEKLFK